MIHLSISLLLAVTSVQPPATFTLQNNSSTQLAKEPIRVYPTPNQQGSLTVQSATKQTVSFYLFDLDGRLLYQARMTKNEEQTIAGLPAGTYFYQAFKNDEEIKGGHVALRN